MKQLKIALTERAKALGILSENWKTISVSAADLTDVSAVVMTSQDEVPPSYDTIHAFGIPLFILDTGIAAGRNMTAIAATVLTAREKAGWKKKITKAAMEYEKNLLPPFFGALTRYTARHNDEYASPGHQSGAFFRKHPSGRIFYDYYGPNVFRGDLSSSDVDLGDFLIHEGPALDAQKHAARVFHADKTYFVLNGTSTSNKIVMNAVLAPGDIVLYDRNNHKSIDHGALVLAGATPVYLETERNAFGSIGGIPEHCFNEEYIRKLVAEKDPEKAKAKRPVRLAVIQLGTYDGCIYNARQVVDKIGHLCDYIFFDSAWVGYEQFIPMMKDCSPLLLNLGPEDPGIIVVQSVHKQQAGFSQASQILKKDSHIKGQKRYLPHKILNNSFMVNSSTSPNYQIFASLDMNAKMQEGESGKLLWHECIVNAIEARKSVIRHCKYLRPIVPPVVHGSKWEDGDTEDMANDISYFAFEPGGKWHSFQGYTKSQYFIDPMKLQLMTPGINMENGEYEDFGIPGIILADYLRDNDVIPEKCDLNDILFLVLKSISTRIPPWKKSFHLYIESMKRNTEDTRSGDFARKCMISIKTERSTSCRRECSRKPIFLNIS